MDIVRVKLEKTKGFSLDRKRVVSCDKAVEIAYEYINNECNSDRENMVVMCLDTKLNVNNISTLATGAKDMASFSTTDVFKTCILSNSNGFILAHNHPSGDSTPSKEDCDVANRIKEAAKILGVRMHDFIIVGDKYDSVSFKGRGLI